MKKTFENWLKLIVFASGMAGIGYLIGESGSAEIEAAQAADLIDAQAQAQQLASLVRKCFKLRGPTAELLQARGDYLCREREIEPVPPEAMHRYALLGSGE